MICIAQMPILQVKQWSHDQRRRSVAQYITQINEQHSSFRDVTENALEKESLFGESAIDESHEILSQNGNDGNSNKTREEIWKHKNEILSNVNLAHTESAFSRDLVSLALYKSQQSQGQLTISQPLKDHIPPGSIGEEAIQLETPDDESQVKDRCVTGGLELEAFNMTVKSIVAATESLENEVRLEAKYWNDAKHVKKEGWSIHRMPGEKQTLGVRIGSLEVGPGYRRKSLVKIERSPRGNMDLKLAGDVANGRRLRVRILHKGSSIASTSISESTTAKDNPILVGIKKARDSLFDEELFYELSREASTLWNRGVKFTNQGIVMPIEKDIEAVMDLADSDQGQADELCTEETALVRRFELWPEAFASSLRILLCHAQRMNRHRRAEIPNGIASGKVSRTVPPLVLPLLSQMQYHTASEEVGDFVNDIILLFSKAKLVIEMQSNANRMQLAEPLGANSFRQTFSFVENLTNCLSNPQPASFQIQLPFISTNVRAMFRVSDSGIEYRYQVSNVSSKSLFHKLPSDMIFHSASELKGAFLDIMRVGLVEIILANVNVGMWQSATPQTGILQRKGQLDNAETSLIRIDLSQFALRVEMLRKRENQNTISKVLSIESKDNAATDLVDVLANFERN